MSVKLELTCPKCDSEAQVVEVWHSVDEITFKAVCTDEDCGMVSSRTAPYEDMAILAHCRTWNRPMLPIQRSKYKH
jgi:hypothetical protein